MKDGDWLSVTLDELGVVHCGQSPSVSEVNLDEVGELYVTGPEQWHEGKITHLKWTTNPKKIAPENSIFITVKGAGVGKMSYGIRAAIGRDVYAFEPSDLLNKKFIYFAISQGINEIVMRALGDIPGISKHHITDHAIHFPNKKTQDLVVEKIETLFAEVDAGVKGLRRARELLGLYRQSVLKHAFEGKLTADWRAANPDKLEDPETLLTRIQTERAAYNAQALKDWIGAVDAWETNGSIGPKPRKPEAYKKTDPVSEEEKASLPDVPDAWHLVRLSEIASVRSGMSVSKGRKVADPVEAPFLRVANVQRGYLDLSEMKTMTIEKSQLPALALRGNDVLFNEGGDRDKLGRGWIWQSQHDPCITQNHVFRASLHDPSDAHAKLISFWGNTVGQQYFEKGGKQTTNLASINKTVLKAFPVPFMGVAETNELISHLDAQLSIVDAQKVEIDAQLARADALRQSILKRAFSGALVPQDSADEPATALLARIRAEREAAPTPKRMQKKQRSSTT